MALSDDLSPGWDAIRDALHAVYGRPPDAHYGTVVPFRLGGPDPIDAFSVWRTGDVLHYVTYGFTELHQKETDDPAVSGYGFELTFRLRHPGDDVPLWPMSLVQNLARYVFKTGNVFAPGHHLDANGPIARDEPTALCAIAFAEDPDLPAGVESPHGRFRFVQIVGLTRGEYDAVLRWNTAGVLDRLRERLPALETELGRASLADDPAFQAAVAEGEAREGSAQGVIYVDRLGAERGADGVWEVRLHARAMAELKRLLRGRIPFDRPFTLHGPRAVVRLVPGEPAVVPADNGLVIQLGAEAARAAAEALPATRGAWEVAAIPGVRFEVTPFVIRDQDGTVVREEG